MFRGRSRNSGVAPVLRNPPNIFAVPLRNGRVIAACSSARPTCRLAMSACCWLRASDWPLCEEPLRKIDPIEGLLSQTVEQHILIVSTPSTERGQSGNQGKPHTHAEGCGPIPGCQRPELTKLSRVKGVAQCQPCRVL